MIKYPKIGDKLYLSQRTGDEWVEMVKRPATVVAVTKGTVSIQFCKCIFDGVRYYDSLPTEILPDPDGQIVKLRWSAKRNRWQYNTADHAGYPEYAYFGEYEYQGYLN